MMHGKGLTKLMEECGELVQAAAKRLAYPRVAVHPDGKNLKVCLEQELADVLAASTFVIERNNLDADAIMKRTEAKLKQYRTWDAQ
jgi:NTP pyrophosphatase (non-canonical NTP hydrolase)